MAFDHTAYDRERRKRDAEYRDARNNSSKRYQATERGRWALKAGNINTLAKMRGGAGRVSGADLIQLFEGAVCAHPDCNISEGLEIDHITPIRFGGRNNLDNLCLLCPDHHRQKTYHEHGMRSRGGDHLPWVLAIAKAEPLQLRLL